MEYKFRAFESDTGNGRMHYSDRKLSKGISFVFQEGLVVCRKYKPFYDMFGGEHDGYTTIDKLMICTGCKDKKDTDIYVDDIVFLDDQGTEAKIVFNKKLGMYIAQFGKMYVRLFAIPKEKMEVRGNVYQNKK